jgi:hypothetical protein
MPPRQTVNGETSAKTSTTLSTRSGDPDAVVDIADKGDLILDIKHDILGVRLGKKFRVNSPILQETSKYFASLLDGRFGESEKIAQAHQELKTKYGNIAEAPSVELPAIAIEDVGRISTVKSIEALVTDFLLILHGRDTLSSAPPPVTNLANLAIVADRFDATDAVREYLRRKKITRAIDARITTKTDSTLSEEKVRQRLLVGLLLEHPPWVDKYSARYIVKGLGGSDVDENAAMWWNLPRRMERELVVRREYVLALMQSIVGHFVSLYSSRERQCRLGYDSSAACDSFQLGEMIRFFSRIGLLQIKSTIFDVSEAPEPYEGDMFTLIDSMRQVPEYQLPFHSHCGVRTSKSEGWSVDRPVVSHVGSLSC